ncbi:hypothetical protein AB6A40_011180 [Gnathostoma spinigerum]|uniref:GPR180/TMEM145 transmembrane domain-containing protein n=1 Tax=Gnathostoma spinigerum TaxID=75299 RepID=A0ABD6EX38_9BILA
MTLRIEESVSPKYWYLMIVGCELSSDCKWVSSPRNITVTYDLWLTNGSPLSKYFNPFGHQFSFDEQDSAEIYLLFLFLYIVLSLIHWRAVALSKKHQFEACRKIISAVIGMKVLGLSLQSLNVVVFAYDGKGISLARYLGEIFRVGSVCLMCLLLLLLSHGWSFSETSESICSNHIAYVWTCLSVIHFVLTTVNFFFVDDVLRDVDVFKAWPGYGMLMLRMVQALWFLAEIRQSIKKEPNDSKAEFLAHFGAGFLVWFLYLSGLGVISMFISVIWRFKVILVITTMANFIAVSCLVHLFWPTGSASKYFQSGEVRFSRRTSRFNSNELEDLEKLLIDDGDESDMEFSNEHFLRL